MDVDLMTLTSILWLVVTVAAVVAAGWLIVTFSRADRDVRRVLEQRLARGEIDIEDYRARMALLGG
jgi:uncharacterized membrane protein